MKRDMELVRHILVFFADRTDTAAVEVPDIPGDYDPVVIKGHLNLLYEAGWIVAEPEVTKTGRVLQVWAFELTWAGHDFVDSIRNESIWNTVTKKLAKVGGAASVDLFKQVAIMVAKERLEIL